MVLETCGGCGFDADEWNRTDTIKTLTHAGDLMERWSAVVPDALVDERPAPGVWSVNEYLDHVGQMLQTMRSFVGAALTTPGADLARHTQSPGPGEHRRHVRAERLDVIQRDAAVLVESLRSLDADGWGAAALLDGASHDVTWVSRHAVHELWHHLVDIADLSVRLGAPLPVGHGALYRVNVSGGGVPKSSLPSADVGRRGLNGDVQKTRVHHGRPWQALCLWSAEVIDTLAADGHPVAPGSAGENLTIAGLDWSTLHGGAIITIGEVVCQLSAPADPCSKIAHCFSDRDSGRIGVDRDPTLTRWYASVLQPGSVAAGDTVVLGHR